LDHEVVVFFGDLNYRINLTNERARELVVEKVIFFSFSFFSHLPKCGSG